MPNLNELVRNTPPELPDPLEDEREVVRDALRRFFAYNLRGRVYLDEQDRCALRWLVSAPGQAALKRHRPQGWANALFPPLGL